MQGKNNEVKLLTASQILGRERLYHKLVKEISDSNWAKAHGEWEAQCAALRTENPKAMMPVSPVKPLQMQMVSAWISELIQGLQSDSAARLTAMIAEEEQAALDECASEIEPAQLDL